jgi:hypothetical protein
MKYLTEYEEFIQDLLLEKIQRLKKVTSKSVEALQPIYKKKRVKGRRKPLLHLRKV